MAPPWIIILALPLRKMSQESYTECQRSYSIIATETRPLATRFLEILPHSVSRVLFFHHHKTQQALPWMGEDWTQCLIEQIFEEKIQLNFVAENILTENKGHSKSLTVLVKSVPHAMPRLTFCLLSPWGEQLVDIWRVIVPKGSLPRLVTWPEVTRPSRKDTKKLLLWPQASLAWIKDSILAVLHYNFKE